MTSERYMVIETFKPGAKDAVYDRFHRMGRLLPDGLSYIDSWLEEDGDRCFQLMATENRALLDEWMSRWSDLVSFEVVKIGNKPTPVAS